MLRGDWRLDQTCEAQEHERNCGFVVILCGASQPPEFLPLRPDTTAEQFRAVRIKSYAASDETIVSGKEKRWKRDGHSSLIRSNKRARLQVKCAKISELD
uniref:Uncharacterized protein n=1 Tax=Noccaea caerulescens TaxID=107243 RepID=A0A1J3HZX3_NOCCA